MTDETTKGNLAEVAALEDMIAFNEVLIERGQRKLDALGAAVERLKAAGWPEYQGQTVGEFTASHGDLADAFEEYERAECDDCGGLFNWPSARR